MAATVRLGHIALPAQHPQEVATFYCTRRRRIGSWALLMRPIAPAQAACNTR